MRGETIYLLWAVVLLSSARGWSVPQEGPLKAFLGQPWLKEAQVFADQHAPNVVVSREGTVVTVFGYPSDVKVRRSEDGGETWADPVLWRDDKGVVHFAYGVLDPAKTREVGEWTFYHRVCRDPKAKILQWSDPVEMAPDRKQDVFFNNKPIRLANGNWLMPVVVRNGKQPDDGKMHPYHWGYESAGALVSSDGGMTWGVAGATPKLTNSGYGAKDTFCWEAGAFQRTDGTVVIFVRNSWGLLQASESRDEGKSWNEFEPVNIPNPTARIHVRKLPTGEVLCLSNPNSRKTFENRSPLAAFISYDDGVSFAKIVILDVNGKVMYPDAELAEDGHTLHLHYESRKEVYFAKFDVREILEPPRGYRRK